MNPTCIIDHNNLLGESPLWCPKTKLLYWVDIKGKSIHSYSPGKKIVQSYPTPGEVSCLALDQKGQLIAGMGKSIIRIELEDPPVIKLLDKVDELIPNNRCNDGKCDRLGRFWIGTMDNNEEKKTGSLYCFSNDKSLKKILSNFVIVNGIGWSPDNTIMYVTDSVNRTIYSFDYDLELGQMKSQRVFALINKKDGYPDGLTVDSKGNVWSAHWDGWKISCYRPDGKINKIIEMPVPRPTSCIFGGENMRSLYVTSSSYRLSEKEMLESPLSGGIFEIDTSTEGLIETEFSGRE